MLYQHGELSFEWDTGKASENRRKHGVSFEEATTVFGDTSARVTYAPDDGSGEDRFLLLGFSEKMRMLLVVHAERGERIRLISARGATREERRQYGRER